MATEQELNEIIKILDPKAGVAKNSIIVIETDDKVMVSTNGSVLAMSSMMAFAMDNNDTLHHVIILLGEFFLKIKEQEEKKEQKASFNPNIIGEA
jgi:hypothetical protein